MAYEHIIQDDDIGEAILVLEREKGWQADGQVHHIQASNGTLEFVYEVRLAQRPDNLQGCVLHETALFYEVKAGGTLSGIAWRYQVLLSDILAMNEITNADLIGVGQLLLIPPVACVSHIVQTGDTLIDIANQYGIPLETLQAYNALSNADLIYPGQELTFPEKQLDAGIFANKPL
jgi:LysM repeat protein